MLILCSFYQDKLIKFLLDNHVILMHHNVGVDVGVYKFHPTLSRGKEVGHSWKHIFTLII